MAGNHNSGRHKNPTAYGSKQLNALYQHAWRIIHNYIVFNEAVPKQKLDTCWNIIYQRDGKPRQMLEHAGNPEKPLLVVVDFSSINRRQGEVVFTEAPTDEERVALFNEATEEADAVSEGTE